MDKESAFNQIRNAGVSTYDIANSIYQATVQGISGANQNKGYGFLLSAMAELWNIKGTIGNPNAKTKITGRYRGMGITEDMIQKVIEQYPNGFNSNSPLFDDLIGVGSMGSSAKAKTDDEDKWAWQKDLDYGEVTKSNNNNVQNNYNQKQSSPVRQNNNANHDPYDREDSILFIGIIIGFVVCKFVLHLGLIASIVLAFVIGGILMMLAGKK